MLAGHRQPHKLLALAEQLHGGVLISLYAALDTAVFAGRIHATLTLEPGILTSATRMSVWQHVRGQLALPGVGARGALQGAGDYCPLPRRPAALYLGGAAQTRG
jgi:hypothetical protein